MMLGLLFWLVWGWIGVMIILAMGLIGIGIVLYQNKIASAPHIGEEQYDEQI